MLQSASMKTEFLSKGIKRYEQPEVDGTACGHRGHLFRLLIFRTSEGVSSLLSLINWAFFGLALIALAGSLFKILRG